MERGWRVPAGRTTTVYSEKYCSHFFWLVEKKQFLLIHVRIMLGVDIIFGNKLGCFFFVTEIFLFFSPGRFFLGSLELRRLLPDATIVLGTVLRVRGVGVGLGGVVHIGLGKQILDAHQYLSYSDSRSPVLIFV